MKTKQPCSPETSRVRPGLTCSAPGRKILPFAVLAVLLAAMLVAAFVATILTVAVLAGVAFQVLVVV